MSTADSSLTPADRDLLNLTQALTRQVFADRDWQLVPPAAEAAFVAEVVQKVRAWRAGSSQPSAKLVERAILNSYCERLHAACRSVERAGQHRAWQEVHRHVRHVARSLNDSPDWADRVPEILERLWQKLDQVNDPGCFLSWTNQVTRNWIRDSQRQDEKEAAMTVSLDEDELEENAPADETPGVESQADPNPEQQAAERQQIEGIVRRCLRSQAQQQVVIGRLLDNLSIKQLADQLGKTPGHVRTLSHRALARLRECADLLEKLQRYHTRRSGQSPDAGDEAIQHFERVLLGPAVAAESCADYRAQLPNYIEAELIGFDVAARYPALKRHLDWCLACEAEYFELLELASAPATGGVDPAVAPADLWFLPHPTLPGYVRRVVGQLAQALRPTLLDEVQAYLDPFLERMQLLGGGPVPTPTPILGETSDALRLVASAYASTYAALTSLSAAELEQPEALAPTLQAQAEREALRQGMHPAAATEFARRYAEIASADAWFLKQLKAP